MDVPFGAVGKNVGIPIAVLFTLIVLLGVANSFVRNGEVSDTCAVNTIILAKGHPSFGVQRKVTGNGDALLRKCNNPL